MTTTSKPTARLLVVDDEVPSMQALCETLKDHGFETVGLSSGSDALAELRQSEFDLVLSDLMMPGMDGIELLRQALAANPNLVGIIMTGQGTIHSAVDAMKTGAFDYILKPFKLNAILPVLARAMVVRQIRMENMALQEGLRKRTAELENINRELRETQSQLVQAAKMASLGQLVAGVAHEINNPLAYVMSHQQTIQRNLDDVKAELEQRLTDGARAKLDKLLQRLVDSRAGLERIEDLVGKLRTFSRLDEGEFKQVNVGENIDAVIALLQHKLKNRIVVNRNFNGGRCLKCYPGPLNQVIMNVISNAIDAIDGPGEINITTNQTASDFLISIADTGRGISEADRLHIFEPFFTTKPVGGGTGLGLSISYGIVKRHNGSLEVHSEVGKGTEMIIRIPVDQTGPEYQAGENSEPR